MLRPKERKERVKLSKSSIRNARKIFSFLRPYRGLFLVGWFFLLVSSVLGLAFPLLMGQLLGGASDAVAQPGSFWERVDIDNVDLVALALFITFGLQAITGFLRIWIFTYVTENALRDIRHDAFSRMIYLPMDFFNQNSVGELTSRISSDITMVQETLRTTVAEFFRQIIIIGGGVVVLLITSWKLALIMLATLPVLAVVAVFFGRFVRKLSREAQDESAKSNSVIEEALMGISNVKSFTNELFMITKYRKSIDNIRRLNVRSGLWRGFFASFVIIFIMGAIVFIVWQGVLMTQGPNPEMDNKGFFTFMMFTIMMGASFGSIPELFASMQKAVGATENLMELIGKPNEKDEHVGRQKPVITGKVAFKNVVFRYPQRKDVLVLDQVSFESASNETIALVGASGAGKSTIASLLLQYYSVSGGSVEFDGVPSTEIELEHLRKHMAIVPQEVILFSGTIRENIHFGNPEASDEEIVEAAKKANAWEFISSFPEQMETQVGDRGIQLSGGQKQRIAIARAILKNPEILILDEATSALDSESEKLVQSALDTLMVGRTSFVIAHRLSTIRKADKILVFEQGKIVEAGSHEALIKSNGTYAKLVELQAMQSE